MNVVCVINVVLEGFVSIQFGQFTYHGKLCAFVAWHETALPGHATEGLQHPRSTGLKRRHSAFFITRC